MLQAAWCVEDTQAGPAYTLRPVSPNGPDDMGREHGCVVTTHLQPLLACPWQGAPTGMCECARMSWAAPALHVVAASNA
jgi:hypothetical protein